ncbi:hypothetical protein U9M48_041863 [Paspalum notatum var. saurae]|uniref:SRP54-type proteins GTP-binding domain-containing protein n=1 Tax=Paspalum notatum var. saurae TaxID=547442 RepID=A0AAQ3UPR5_PASNO
MLDELLIFTRGGLILWALSGGGVTAPVDALIRTCLLGAGAGAGAGSFEDGKHELSWAFDNALGLVFVAVYRRVLRLLYGDALLAAVRAEFARLYRPSRTAYHGFGDVFRQLHLEAQARAEQARRPANKPPPPQQQKPADVAPPSAVVKDAQRDSGGGSSAGGEEKEEQGASDGDSSGGKEESGADPKSEEGGAFNLSILHNLRDKVVVQRNKDGTKKPKPKPNHTHGKNDHTKKPRPPGKNDISAPPDMKLDFTDPAPADPGVVNHAPVNEGQSKMDRDDEDDKVGDDDDDGPRTKAGWFSTVFRSIGGAGNNSAITRSDLEPALGALKDRLMAKNVAEEIAGKLCESVAASLEGKALGPFSFTSVPSTARAAMEDALLRILTPARSVDVLRGVRAARDRGRPYVAVFVGVNGVGKSTSLAKVAYWLRQHGVSVTLAACDTFRSGAVEQLRTHARRLGIPIFEKGYQRDPAVVAKLAIEDAARRGCDVVLVDTAGRMQDNEPLMRALAKLITVNSPDLVLFVGEALVGNDAVDQLTQFNRKLADLSAAGRLIDGILLSKFDTVDDKVGAALSMVYVSGAPVMFVGCGQSYTDLKKLNVKSIVYTLLK